MNTQIYNVDELIKQTKTKVQLGQLNENDVKSIEIQKSNYKIQLEGYEKNIDLSLLKTEFIKDHVVFNVVFYCKQPGGRSLFKAI